MGENPGNLTDGASHVVNIPPKYSLMPWRHAMSDIQRVHYRADFWIIERRICSRFGTDAVGAKLSQLHDAIAHPYQRKLAAANIVDRVQVRWRSQNQMD